MEQPFERLLVWEDPVARSGPENMAMDEALLEGLGEEVVLRIYGWEGAWVSLGYFQKLEEARRVFAGEEVEFVRRMTGGGMVDHREDVTYTLLVPRGHGLAEARGEESYRVIHGAVVEALRRAGVAARMVSEDGGGESPACFEKAVAWDVVGADGRKMAGAGQKRGKTGLMHQGSVLGCGAVRGELAGCLGREVVKWGPGEEGMGRVGEVCGKYGSGVWVGRR